MVCLKEANVMQVRCAACSEEFLGAVNRCWKCGAYVTLNLEAFQVPPIRRPPVSLRPKPATEEIATAELVDASAPPSGAALQGSASPGGQGYVRRRGNPFAVAEPNGAVFVPIDSETLANEVAAEKGVWLGVTLGVVAWMLAFFFPPAALVSGILAIGLAIWGLASRKKALAGAVLVLCVLGFAISGYKTARWTYDLIAPNLFESAEFDEDL